MHNTGAGSHAKKAGSGAKPAVVTGGTTVSAPVTPKRPAPQRR